MARLLFNVSEVIDLPEGGMIVTSDVRIERIPVVVSPGQKLEFRNVNGDSIGATVRSIEVPGTFNPHRRLTIQVDKAESHQVIPKGAEVWLIELNS